MLARKLNLRPEIRQELFDGAREIVRLVTSVDPTLLHYDSWMFSEDYAATDGKSRVTFFDDGTKSYDTHPMIPEAKWENLKVKFPFIPQFFERFGFSKFFIRIPFTNVSQANHDNYDAPSDAHRHVYRSRSWWNLVLFDENTEGSRVFFVDPEIPSLVRQPGPDPKDEFELLQRGLSPQVLEEIQVHEGDVYSFNTWEWHAYHYNAGTSCVYFFYLEGAVDEESMEKACQRLESM